MPRITAIWKQVTDSLWFVPAIITLIGAAAALLLVRLDRQSSGISADELWWLFGGGAEGARGVLGAIAGGIITVTGVVFSVTIVALQLASTQFTPRVLRQFMADRANQVVLGVFIATFTFTLLVQRTVRSGGDSGGEFVPAYAVTGALALALVAIGFLIFFIDHLARSIQAEEIIRRVSEETLTVIRALERDQGEVEPPSVPFEEDGRSLCARRSGYLQAMDEESLVKRAVRHDLVVRVHTPLGGYVLSGQTVARVWGERGDDELENNLQEAFFFGHSRTPHQDVALGIIELVDIAVKALSPGINDPTTAITAIHSIGNVLLELGLHSPADVHVHSHDGRVRVISPRLGFRAAVELGFGQIRHFGASNPAVAIRIAATLRMVTDLLPTPLRAPLLDQLRLLRADAEREVPGAHDRARVMVEIEAGLQAS